jgi:uncharacterized protein YjbI with pentapeptide repeats
MVGPVTAKRPTSGAGRAEQGAGESASAVRAPDADIQAALSMLGGRTRVKSEPGVRINLARTDLRRAALRGANLERAYLWGALRAPNLVLADLSEANLEGTDLRRGPLRTCGPEQCPWSCSGATR